MKISSLTAYPVQGPMGDLCFVKVDTDQGVFGWGEGSLPGKCDSVAAAIHEFAPLVTGMDVMAIERIWQRMVRHSYWKAGPILSSAIAAIDIALWDIKGKALNVPVCALLGGPVRDKIWLYANLGLSSDPDELRARTQAAKAKGYHAVKFYPLPPVAPMESPAAFNLVAACCEAVRDELGEDGVFALDFHGRCTPNVAVQMERAVRHTRPLWIEEPTAPEDLGALRRVQEKAETPIAMGERLNSRWQFREAFEQRLVDVIQPDVANCYGISELRRLADMAEMYGVAFAPHNPNGWVQERASMHLAASMSAFSILEHRHDTEEAMAAFAEAEDVLRGDGWADVPSAPGLGITLDEAALADMKITERFVHESFRRDGTIADW